MTDCVFCKIAAGDIPAQVVFEDDAVIAFLDTNPLSPGHTLVIPKTHAEQLTDLDEATAEAVLMTVWQLNGSIQDAVDADAANVGFNDGSASGQEVPHVHGHIIPRFSGDGGGPIHRVAGSRPDLSDEDMEKVQGQIKDQLRRDL